MNQHSSLTIEIPDPSLVLLIGASGAGKSTFAARHFLPTEIVSSDRCRAMICDDESNQDINTGAFALLHHITRLRLANRRLTVIDATNLQFRARRPLLRMSRAYRLPAVAIVFNVSLETSLKQNLLRQPRFVNEEVIKQHKLQLDMALSRLGREGYARIYVVNEDDLGGLKVEKLSKRDGDQTCQDKSQPTAKN